MFAHEFDSNIKILVVRIAAKLILAAKKKKQTRIISEQLERFHTKGVDTY